MSFLSSQRNIDKFENDFIHTIKQCISTIKHKRHITDCEKTSIYVSGDFGIGKTHNIKQILTKYDYDVIEYNAISLSKRVIQQELTSSKMSNTNIMAMFHKKRQQKILLIDNIEVLYDIGKNIFTSLMHLIRPKRIQSQKKEDTVNVPVIIIGNLQNNKGLTELEKYTYSFRMPGFRKRKMMDYFVQYIKHHSQSSDKDVKEITIPSMSMPYISSFMNKNIFQMNHGIKYSKNDNAEFLDVLHKGIINTQYNVYEDALKGIYTGNKDNDLYERHNDSIYLMECIYQNINTFIHIVTNNILDKERNHNIIIKNNQNQHNKNETKPKSYKQFREIINTYVCEQYSYFLTIVKDIYSIEYNYSKNQYLSLYYQLNSHIVGLCSLFCESFIYGIIKKTQDFYTDATKYTNVNEDELYHRMIEQIREYNEYQLSTIQSNASTETSTKTFIIQMMHNLNQYVMKCYSNLGLLNDSLFILVEQRIVEQRKTILRLQRLYAI